MITRAQAEDAAILVFYTDHRLKVDQKLRFVNSVESLLRHDGYNTRVLVLDGGVKLEIVPASVLKEDRATITYPSDV